MKKDAGNKVDVNGDSPPQKGGSPLLIARLAAGCVLMVSGFLKLLEPVEEFAAAIELYQILPSGMIPFIAGALPWVELVAGGYLAAGFLTRSAAVVSGTLYSIFILALGSSLIRGLPLGECGCFGGAGPHLAPWQALTLDAVLLILTTMVFINPLNFWSLDSWIKKDEKFPSA